MKKGILIKSLVALLVAPAFSMGVAQASPSAEKPGILGNLSQSGVFQMAQVMDTPSGSDDIGPDGLKRRGDGSIDDTQPGQVSGNDDIGPDGLKRRGDGSIDDDQPGHERGDRHKMRSRNRGHGNADDRMDNAMRTDNSGKGRMDRLDSDNRGRGRGRGRHGRIERPDHEDRSGRSARVERPERQDRSGRSDRAERPDRVKRPDRAERPDRVKRPDRAERPDRVKRPDRVERPDRVKRPERAERPDRSGRGGRG